MRSTIYSSHDPPSQKSNTLWQYLLTALIVGLIIAVVFNVDPAHAATKIASGVQEMRYYTDTAPVQVERDSVPVPSSIEVQLLPAAAIKDIDVLADDAQFEPAAINARSTTNIGSRTNLALYSSYTQFATPTNHSVAFSESNPYSAYLASGVISLLSARCTGANSTLLTAHGIDGDSQLLPEGRSLGNGDI